MLKETNRNIRLGLLVLIGTGILIFALYLMGVKQNIFGSTFQLKAQFKNVNGLMPGNNVRFTGIDVGTVEKVTIMNDSTVNVEMIIDDDVQAYIKKNSLASVGTDGLMGNKLINIFPVAEDAPSVEDGDVLKTKNPVSTDDMLRTLNVTNENVKEITIQMRKIVEKLNSPNTLWSILMDTVVAENVKQAIVHIKLTGERSALITGDLERIVRHVKEGRGSIGALLMDTSLAQGIRQSIVNVKIVTDSIALITGDLHSITTSLKSGKGAIGTLLMDTIFVKDLNQTMKNLNQGTKGFDDNMEALKKSFLLRKYFKKAEKKQPSPKR